MKVAHAISVVTRAPRESRIAPRPLDAARALLRAGALDRELARGVPSWRSPVHAARSLQLTSRRGRAAIASSLDDLVARSGLPRRHLFGSAAIEPCREQVWHALPRILEITSRLRRSEPIASRGAAGLLELLRDATGPCYHRTHRGALSVALDRVTPWLDTEG